MTSQGSALTRLRRALLGGNPTIAWAAAHEVRRLELADAIALCLLQLPTERARYERAAVKLIARLCGEVPGLTLAEAQLAVSALVAACEGEGGASAAALAELLASHGVDHAAEAIERWAARNTS